LTRFQLPSWQCSRFGFFTPDSPSHSDFPMMTHRTQGYLPHPPRAKIKQLCSPLASPSFTGIPHIHTRIRMNVRAVKYGRMFDQNHKLGFYEINQWIVGLTFLTLQRERTLLPIWFNYGPTMTKQFRQGSCHFESSYVLVCGICVSAFSMIYFAFLYYFHSNWIGLLIIDPVIVTLDPDWWGLEWGDVQWDPLTRRSAVRNVVLHILHSAHPVWELYPSSTSYEPPSTDSAHIVDRFLYTLPFKSLGSLRNVLVFERNTQFLSIKITSNSSEIQCRHC
jgi:hypothetical protein